MPDRREIPTRSAGGLEVLASARCEKSVQGLNGLAAGRPGEKGAGDRMRRGISHNCESHRFIAQAKERIRHQQACGHIIAGRCQPCATSKEPPARFPEPASIQGTLK